MSLNRNRPVDLIASTLCGDHIFPCDTHRAKAQQVIDNLGVAHYDIVDRDQAPGPAGGTTVDDKGQQKAADRAAVADLLATAPLERHDSTAKLYDELADTTATPPDRQITQPIPPDPMHS